MNSGNFHKRAIGFLLSLVLILITTACSTSVIDQSDGIAAGIKKFDLDQRESEILTESMVAFDEEFRTYQFIISDEHPSKDNYKPSIVKEDVIHNESIIDIRPYFALDKPHAFIYGFDIFDNRENATGKAARIHDYMGKGTVHGKEVYAVGDSIAYLSVYNDGQKKTSIDLYKVHLYAVGSDTIKKTGEITKHSDGSETVNWLDNGLTTAYPVNMEKGKEYYYVNTPHSREYLIASGFKNLTIDGNVFLNCLEIKETLVVDSPVLSSLFFNTCFYAQDYGRVYCESKGITIDKNKKEVTYYGYGPEYFIQNGKAEWTNDMLNISSFQYEEVIVDSTNEPANTNNYINSDYGFTLLTPVTWKDRYAISEEASSISEVEKEIKLNFVDNGKTYDTLFTLYILRPGYSADYIATLDPDHMWLTYLTELANGQVVAYRLSSEPSSELLKPENQDLLSLVSQMMNGDALDVIKSIRSK